MVFIQSYMVWPGLVPPNLREVKYLITIFSARKV